MQAHCPKCKVMRDIANAQIVQAANGTPLTRGIIAKFADNITLFGRDFVFGFEIVLDVYTHVFEGQVADVTYRGANAVIVAEVLADGLCLGGRFDNDERAAGGSVGLADLLGSKGFALIVTAVVGAGAAGTGGASGGGGFFGAGCFCGGGAFGFRGGWWLGGWVVGWLGPRCGRFQVEG